MDYFILLAYFPSLKKILVSYQTDQVPPSYFAKHVNDTSCYAEKPVVNFRDLFQFCLEISFFFVY